METKKKKADDSLIIRIGKEEKNAFSEMCKTTGESTSAVLKRIMKLWVMEEEIKRGAIEKITLVVENGVLMDFKKSCQERFQAEYDDVIIGFMRSFIKNDSFDAAIDEGICEEIATKLN